MKKSIIATGVVVALVAGWGIASWHSGKVLENNRESYTEQANEQLSQLTTLLVQNPVLAHMMPKLTLTLEDYKRGFFSSTARYSISEPNEKNIDERLYLTAHIEHGPFPISELLSFRLAPKAAVINIELDNTKLTKPFFDITKGQSPLLVTIVPAIDATRSRFTIAPIDFWGFKLNNFWLQTTVANDLSYFDLSGNIDTFSVDKFYFNTPSSSGLMSINGVQFDSKMNKGNFINYVGTQETRIKSLSFTTTNRFRSGIPEITLEDISSKSNLKESVNDVSYDFVMTLGKVKLDDKELGRLEMGSDVSRINGRSLANAIQLEQKRATASQHDIDTAVYKLLQDSPLIKLYIKLSNSAGLSNYSASVELNNTSLPLRMLSLLPEEEIIGELLKTVESELIISLPMVKEIAVSMIEVIGLGSKADAEKLFDEVIKQLPAYMQEYDKNNMLTLNGGQLESRLRYSDGILTINGQQIPLIEFVQTMK